MKSEYTVAEGALDAPAQVQGMFSRIAGRYDMANALLSGGMDWFWRRGAARVVREWEPERLLDLATGSGVLAGTLQRSNPGTVIVGADFCLPMLRQARKAGRLKQMVVADAMSLPFAEGSFDAVTVAFGLRNMPSYLGALREIRRVLRPGGHLLVLDFSVPEGWWRGAYRLYLHRFLPKIAGVLSGERNAYEYLAESIERFPRGEGMLRLLESAGFSAAKVARLSGGIVSLYTAETTGPAAEVTPSR